MVVSGGVIDVVVSGSVAVDVSSVVPAELSGAVSGEVSGGGATVVVLAEVLIRLGLSLPLHEVSSAAVNITVRHRAAARYIFNFTCILLTAGT